MTRILFTTRFANPVISQIFSGATDFALEQKGTLIVRDRLEQMDPECTEELRNKWDGILIWPGAHDWWAPALWQLNYPIVACNAIFEGSMPSASFDDALQIGIEFIGRLGRKHAAFVCPDTGEPNWRHRARAFLESFRGVETDARVFDQLRIAPSLSPAHIFEPDQEPELVRFLTEIPKPATIFCVNDFLAALVCETARFLDLKIPVDLAIFGVGDTDLARQQSPTISSIPVPGRQLGYEAMKLLHSFMSAPFSADAPPTRRLLSGPPVERESTGGASAFHSGIAKAHRMITEQACEGITVDHLISESRMSRATFYRLYQDAYQISPGEALKQSRINRALDLIANSDFPIARVAGLCGFSSASQFNNFFRRATGRTPTEWRSNPE